jgi:hypothetical protein
MLAVMKMKMVRFEIVMLPRHKWAVSSGRIRYPPGGGDMRWLHVYEEPIPVHRRIQKTDLTQRSL